MLRKALVQCGKKVGSVIWTVVTWFTQIFFSATGTMSSQELWTRAVTKARGTPAGRKPASMRRSSSQQLLRDIRQGEDLSRWEPDLCIQMLCIPAAQNYAAIRKLIQKSSEKWHLEFLERDGLGVLLESLERLCDRRTCSVADTLAQTQCVACIREAINSTFGLQHIVSKPEYTRKMANILTSHNTTVKLQVFELLCAVCMITSSGHSLALDALQHFKVTHGLRYRFEVLINELSKGESVVYKATLLAFINCLILGSTDLHQRNRIRKELLGIGLHDILNSLRQLDEEELHIQIKVFDEHQHNDEEELEPLELSLHQLFETIYYKVMESPQELAFHALLLNLSQLDPKDEQSDTVWQELEEVSLDAISKKSYFGAMNQKASRNRSYRRHRRSKSLCKSNKLHVDATTQTETTCVNVSVQSDDDSDISKDISMETISTATNESVDVPTPPSLPDVNRSCITSSPCFPDTFSSFMQYPVSQRSNPVASIIDKCGSPLSSTSFETNSPPALFPQLETKRSLVPLPLLLPETASPPVPPPFPEAAGVPPVPPPFPEAAGVPPVPPPFPEAAGVPPVPPPFPEAAGVPPVPPPFPEAAGVPPVPPPFPEAAGVPPVPPPFPEAAGVPPVPPPFPEAAGVPPVPPPFPEAAGVPPPFSKVNPPPHPLPFPGMSSPPAPPPLPGSHESPIPPPLPVTGKQILLDSCDGCISISKRIISGSMTVPSRHSFPPNLKDYTMLEKWNTVPRRKMRTINWNKIPVGVVNNSMWKETSINSTKVSSYLSKMEELFCQKNIAPRRVSSPSALSTVVNLLDSKRSLAVNIFLKQFKNSTDEIVNSVSQAKSFLGPEKLKNLLHLLPDKNELALIKSHPGDPERLGTAEKFFLKLSHVPDYTLRIEAMLLREEFPSRTSELKLQLQSLIDTSKQVMNSSSLKQFLNLILYFGNIMNAGSYAGNAAGFQLSTLPKLLDIRANKPRTTFLHFIVEVAEFTDQGALSFIEEIKQVKELARLPFDALEGDIRDLAKDVQHISSLLKGSTGDIKLHFSDFMEKASKSVEDLQNMLEEVKMISGRLAQHFCEDPKQKLEEYFRLLADFFQKVQQSHIDNEQACKQEESAARREAEMEKCRGKLKKTIIQQQDKNDLLCRLLAEIRDGNYVLKPVKVNRQ